MFSNVLLISSFNVNLSLKKLKEFEFIFQFQLVCGLKFWSGVLTTSYLVGVMVGAVSFGYMSDR